MQCGYRRHSLQESVKLYATIEFRSTPVDAALERATNVEHSNKNATDAALDEFQVLGRGANALLIDNDIVGYFLLFVRPIRPARSTAGL
jgi:hypothetical protein